MKQNLISLFAGFLFGIGLILSQMSDPNKVLNFLDAFGNWDPSLAFVMLGALSVTFITYYFIPRKLSTPLLDTKFRIPTRKDIDKPLIMGAVIFGIGWGMSGYCPGPVVVNLGFGNQEAVMFIASMIVGFYAHRSIFDKKS